MSDRSVERYIYSLIFNSLNAPNRKGEGWTFYTHYYPKQTLLDGSDGWRVLIPTTKHPDLAYRDTESCSPSLWLMNTGDLIVSDLNYQRSAPEDMDLKKRIPTETLREVLEFSRSVTRKWSLQELKKIASDRGLDPRNDIK